MNIKIEKQGREICSIENWFDAAPPKGEINQWKNGRSAKEMARFGISDKFKCVIEKVLDECGVNDYPDFVCEPEANTVFPKTMGSGGPRNHDLLMRSASVVIGIEAKVSEPFDIMIKQWLDKGKTNADGGENRKKRINSFIDLLKVTEISECLDLYYQLFSATVGTIVEARKQEVNKSIVLVIEFGGDVDKGKSIKAFDDAVRKNQSAFDDFLSFLGIKGNESKINVEYEGQTIEVWFKKIHVDIVIPKYEYKY